MTIVLNAVEARVLGALMEKEATTPEYYPLSLNALVNACNQKNSREPAMQLGEDEVRLALHGLEDDGLVAAARGAESRVAKYEHRMQEAFNWTRGEAATMCVLLLRGPQTPGELRGRTERMHRFEELEDVAAVLQRLMQRDPPLVAALARQPGTKEIRYTQLLTGPMDAAPAAASPEGDAGVHRTDGRRAAENPAAGSGSEERVQRLEEDVARLREEVAQLKKDLAALSGRES
jgi:uncharacterized protein